MFGAWREKCSELGLSQSLSGKVEAEGNIEVQHEGQFRIANVKGDGNCQFRQGIRKVLKQIRVRDAIK